ncbi:MAG: hypothetical protein SF339_28205 [Blastocatellia bacterium]|nr:hypothetical protein [Blastocatellia bacterium]
MRSNEYGFLTRWMMSAILILSQVPAAAFGAPAQGQEAPDAVIKITEITNEKIGGGRTVVVKWAVGLKGGAVEQGFDVRAVIKIANGGGTVVRTLSLPAGARKAGLIVNGNEGIQAATLKPKTKEIQKGAEKSKGKAAGGKENNGTQGTIQPTPKPGAGGFVVIESADVTVTGKFSGGAEAVNILREFTPPAQAPTGELRVKSGNNQGDIQIANLIDLEKSSRAAQCATGRDCFEVLTVARNAAGNGGKGVVVNIEVFYADGSRKTDSKAVGSPGRPIVLSVDNPSNTPFTSVRVRLRNAGDGTFTRTAKREELLSF